MATFVLIHGAWHGGWCWREVAAELRSDGHEVLTPTLTGLGDRAHLLTPAVDLATHVRDVTAVLDYEEIAEATLVAHSYSALLAPAVVHADPRRITQVVVLDGFMAHAGEIPIELLPEHAAVHYRDSAREHGEGWRIPPRPMAKLGVRDAQVIARVTPKLTSHPYRTYFEPIEIGIEDVHVPGRLAVCAGWSSPFARFQERAAARGWRVDQLPADHEIMLTQPSLLTDYLRGVAQSPPTSASQRQAAVAAGIEEAAS